MQRAKSTEIDQGMTRKIPFEITEVRKRKRVVIRSGEIDKEPKEENVIGLVWKKHFYFGHLDQLLTVTKKGFLGREKKVDKIMWDFNWSEPLDENGVPHYSEELENELMNSGGTQLVNAIISLQSFTLSRYQLGMIGLTMLFGSLIGLGLESFIHLAPSTVIHWLPSAPR